MHQEAALSSSRPLWSVGTPGLGPGQFGGSWPTAEAPPLVAFEVGADDPAEVWPAFHPGPWDAQGGWRGHRLEIDFTVPEPAPDSPAEGARPAAGGWLLQLFLFASHGPCPDLAIAWDGRHRGGFRPRIVRESRAEVWGQSPINGHARVDVPVPADWLAPGRHRLSVTTTLPGALDGDGPPAEERRRHREQYGNWFGSGFTWDCLRLLPAGPPPKAPTSALRATPFYRTVDGVSCELFDLTVGLAPGRPAPRRALVRIGDHRTELDLSTGEPAAQRDFGQLTVRFPVPEPGTDGGRSAPLAAEVRLDEGPATATEVFPARKWTLHLIPHVHLDIGFTDYQGKVIELHNRNLDRALDAGARDPEFAYSVDGAMVVAEYLASRDARRAERVLTALREGRMAVNAFHSLFLSGLASLEESYRAATVAARLRAEHGVPVRHANLTDVPSYSAALPGVLAELGLDGFVGIMNHARGGNADSDLLHLDSPFLWEGVDGTRVLTHYADSYSQLRFMAADPQTLDGGAQAFDRYVARYERADYLPSDLALVGTHADNEDLADGDHGFVARWNAVHDWPRLVISTLPDYLDAVRPLADRLPVHRGDGGSYWEDGAGTAAALTAEHRLTQSLLPAAEALTALLARGGAGLSPRTRTLDGAWDDALYGCEHTFTWSHANAHPEGHQVHDQLDWKRSRVHRAHRTALDEIRRALSQLGDLVTTRGPALLVANPGSEPLSGDVVVELPADAVVFDDEGRTLPAEVLTVHTGGLRRLRLSVPEVPAFGWRVLPLGGGEAEVGPGGAEGSGETGPVAARPFAEPPAPPEKLETPRWSVEFDQQSGLVKQLVHRESGRALLNVASPWRLGQLLHVADGPEELTRGDGSGAFAGHHHHGDTFAPLPTAAGRTTLHDRLPPAPPPALSVTPATTRAAGVRRTHDGHRLRWTGAAPHLPAVDVELLLRDEDDRVEVTVTLEKEAVLSKESVYVAFPFAATRPTVHYDRQQGWIDPAVDHPPGACHEWLTTQYGVAVTEGGPEGAGVVWSSADAPLFTVGDIVRGTWPTRFDPASGTVLSWVMNNYWPTNTPPSQAGSLTLRYAFTPVARFDPAAAGAFGRRLRHGLLASEITRLDRHRHGPGPLPATGTLLDLPTPPHIRTTVAAARTAEGLLVRLQNLSEDEQEVTLPHPDLTTAPEARALRCMADERPVAELPLAPDGTFTVVLRGHGVVSVLLVRG
ncbi:Glycosyl hydrolases family 38 N-terminal domain-containing protein [Streptomyces zhaozhouensis]|uniref:Glycosyl hydrolases family 38 N-terminal domain-containing protein n=1 Tax=Streptomyces zhaozhouensis TaxID=1300267 RepID=A0A286DKN9_9ACTN|nr:hypothetical protein [Streptomyces zhaozhouensis]SOD59171.1 Glycosyl hydrolases family 38 N-terminal domain-containing protein [Streptomyces zhaozhouensis]